MKIISKLKIKIFCPSLKIYSTWLIYLGIMVAVLGITTLYAQQTQFEESYLLPPKSVQDILNRDRHYDVLNAVSPEGDYFIIPIIKSM